MASRSLTQFLYGIRPVPRTLVRQFGYFTTMGSVGTAAHYALLTALVYLLLVHPVVASCFGFVVGGMINYLLNHRFTFSSHEPHGSALPKFFTVAGIGLCLNGVIMAVGTGLLMLHYLVAQVLATGLVLMWNFGVNRSWTFRGTP